MNRIEYRDVHDKSAWERGPWDQEPDKVQWQDEATGLPCLIVRGPVGAWCGYVGVGPDHPFHGSRYRKIEDNFATVVELTFSGGCHDGPEDSSICHVPAAGEPDNVWWFGFDCAHIYDIAPGMKDLFALEDATYKDIAWVTERCAKLAQQLRDLGEAPDS